MTNFDADPWGSWSYDRTPGNMLLDPAELREHLAEAQEYPDELARQAHISLELATHPELSDAARLPYASIAAASYDKLVEEGEADLTVQFIHAYLPLMLPSHSKTARKKAACTARERSVAFAGLLQSTFEESEDSGTKRQTIGHAAEHLATATARLLGYPAVPSQYRQDRAIPYVAGRRYSWDVTVPTGNGCAINGVLLQVKHRDFDDGKVGYHSDITLHRVFRAEERMNAVAPKVFDLLRTALQINGPQDHGRFNKYRASLTRDLSSATSM